MKRVGKRGEGKFQRISWEEAISTIASEMTRIKNTYGAASRYCNYATGYEMCAATPSVMIRRLLALDGCYCWTDMIENAQNFTADMGLRGVKQLDTNIKLIFNLSGNCLINQHGDCNYTAALLSDASKVEFIVCSDIFLTPSARFADILLPGTTMLETENITASPARFDHFFKINPVIEPVGECRFEYDWICDIAKELHLYDAFSEGKTLHQWLNDCLSHLQKELSYFPNMDIFTRDGVYKRNQTAKHIAFEEEINDFIHHPFKTPSGKIEIFVPSLYEQHKPDINPIPGYMSAWEGPEDPLTEVYPLQCIIPLPRQIHSIPIWWRW